MREMGAQPFIGSEALAAGLISWHELGKYYTAIMPNVYLDKRLKSPPCGNALSRPGCGRAAKG